MEKINIYNTSFYYLPRNYGKLKAPQQMQVYNSTMEKVNTHYERQDAADIQKYLKNNICLSLVNKRQTPPDDMLFCEYQIN